MTLLFLLSSSVNTAVLWGLTCNNRARFYLFLCANCKPVWLEGTALCAAAAHPDLGRVHNTLGQLGTNEGHFVAVFYLVHRGAAPGLQGWPTEPKTKSCTVRSNNNTGLFTASVNKNTRQRPVTPTGKVTSCEDAPVCCCSERTCRCHKTRCCFETAERLFGFLLHFNDFSSAPEKTAAFPVQLFRKINNNSKRL